jgi:hypothetical protein
LDLFFEIQSCPQNNCDFTSRNDWSADASTTGFLSQSRGNTLDPNYVGCSLSLTSQAQKNTQDLVLNIGLARLKDDTELSTRDMLFVPGNSSSIRFDGDWQEDESIKEQYPMVCGVGRTLSLVKDPSFSNIRGKGYLPYAP